MTEDTLTRAEPLYKQMALRLQQMIETGELKPGDLIPSTSDLSKSFKVAHQTAHNALRELSQRGLVVRIPKKGSFVNNNLTSKTVALLTGNSLLEDPASILYSRMSVEAARYLNGKGWNTKFYIPTIQEELGKVLDGLSHDIRRGQIKFVLILTATPEVIQWAQKECGVPWIVALASTPGKKQFESLIDCGFPYLAERQYRHVGLIYSLSQGEAQPLADGYFSTHNHPFKLSFFRTETNCSADGMKKVIEDIDPSNCPDALFVLNDNLCRGVILGLYAKGLTFPDKIGLLTHANAGIDILSPVPLTRIEYTPIKILHANIEKIIETLNGKTLPPTTHSLLIVEGESCRKAQKDGNTAQRTL